MDTPRAENPFSPRLIVGLAVMAWGLLLTLDNFDIIDARQYWKLWPVILIAAGLARVVESLRTGGPVCGGLMTLVGVALLLHNLDLLRLKRIWPFFLLLVGGSLVWKAIRGPLREGGTQPADSGNRLEAFIMMGGVSKRTSSQDFRGGSATAVMGGAEIDLRKASIQDGPAVFDTFAFWGGVEIKVPEDWAVESRVLPLLAGYEDTTRPPVDAKKRLIVTGIAIMGGVEVKN